MSKRHISVVTRIFQGGKDWENYDRKSFTVKAEALAKVGYFPEVKKIYIVTCGDKSSKFAEIPDSSGEHPTVRAVREYFGINPLLDTQVVPLISYDWGANAGSPTALNTGIRASMEDDGKYVMCLSPELDIDGYLVHDAMKFAESRRLQMVGFWRENFWMRFQQWGVPQNTACVWDKQALYDIGGFDPVCAGTGQTTRVEINGKDFDVAVAGMEDMQAAFRLLKKIGEDFRFGVVGIEELVPWDIDPSDTRQAEKIARQSAVMERYVRLIFGETVDIKRFFNDLFRGHFFVDR